MELNKVIAGKYEGKKNFSCFGNLYILTGFMKWKKLNFDSFKRYKILKKNHEGKFVYIKFHTGEELAIYINNRFYGYIAKYFKNYYQQLRELPKVNSKKRISIWKIIGYIFWILIIIGILFCAFIFAIHSLVFIFFAFVFILTL